MLAWVMNLGFAASPSNAPPPVTEIHTRGFAANIGTMMMVRTIVIFVALFLRKL